MYNIAEFWPIYSEKIHGETFSMEIKWSEFHCKDDCNLCKITEVLSSTNGHTVVNAIYIPAEIITAAWIYQLHRDTSDTSTLDSNQVHVKYNPKTCTGPSVPVIAPNYSTDCVTAEPKYAREGGIQGEKSTLDANHAHSFNPAFQKLLE